MNKIKLEKWDNERIKVTFPHYSPFYVFKIKSIAGCRWHPEEKFWSLPNTDKILKKILKVFENEGIYLDPALKPEGSLKGNHHDFENLRRELISRKYSYKTIKSYIQDIRSTSDITPKLRVYPSLFGYEQVI